MREVTKDAAQTVLDCMHQGESLRQSCISAGISTRSFMDWVALKEENAQHYVLAREAMIDKLADETMELSDAPIELNDKGNMDPAAVQARKLQVDTRKWILSKLAPKKYGEKVEQTIVGDADQPLVINFVAPPERDGD